MNNGDNAIQITAIVVNSIVAVIMAFAIVLAPSLAEIIKALMFQPNPSPNEKKPKKRSQSSGGTFHLFRVQFLFIAFNFALLAWLLFDSSPPTRLTVFGMAVAVGSIVLAVLHIALVRTQQTIGRTVEVLAELFEGQTDLSDRTIKLAEALRDSDRQTREVVGKIVDVLADLKDATRKKPDALDALRESVRRLLGD